jgi:uncharacterized protein (TIGR02996 family)
MTDRDGLLRAICASPDDDAPRLVYADWLDEHGDGLLAEFIRVQIALAKLSTDRRDEHPLSIRASQLFAQKSAWKNVIGHDVQTVANFDLDKFHRGFHHVWFGEVHHFVRLPKDWWRFGPIDLVMIGFGSPKSAEVKHAEKAAKQAILPRVRTVCLLGMNLNNKWIETFLSLSDGCDWHRFELLSNRVTDATCTMLAQSRLATSACELFIDSNRVSATGRQTLKDVFGERLANRTKTDLG